MIRSLKNFFSRRSTVNLPSNSTIATLVDPDILSTVRVGSENREQRGERPPSRRETPSRRGLLNQPVTINVSNGVVIVDPIERDLYDGEQVVWICNEPAWETRFDVVETGTPFENDRFGPGLLSEVAVPEADSDFPQIEVPTEPSGSIRDDILGGDFAYSVEVSGFAPLSARVKVFRGNRPR